MNFNEGDIMSNVVDGRIELDEIRKIDKDGTFACNILCTNSESMDMNDAIARVEVWGVDAKGGLCKDVVVFDVESAHLNLSGNRLIIKESGHQKHIGRIYDLMSIFNKCKFEISILFRLKSDG